MLHPRHIRLLKKIKKNKVIRNKKPNKDIDYLYESGYIEVTEYDKPEDLFIQPHLTERGLARLYEEKRKFIEVWLPVTISNLIAFVALIISIIALSK